MTTRRALLTLAGAGLLAGCTPRYGPPQPPPPPVPVASGGPPVARADLVGGLAFYPSRYRFTPADRIAFGDAPGRAREEVALRTEIIAFLEWARTHGHPEIRPALPAIAPGQDHLVDPLLVNSDLLDTEPLFGAAEPIGRLVPDNHTVNADMEGLHAALVLIMLKAMLSRADHTRLITESPLVTAAGGGNFISIYPYTTAELTRSLLILSGVVIAFYQNTNLRWLVENPVQAMYAPDRQRLLDAGGTTEAAKRLRVVYIDSSRAGHRPSTIARSLFEAFLAVQPK